MLTQDLKEKVDSLTREDRHELSIYLTKLDLESDPDFWKTVNERLNDKNPELWVKLEDVN